MKKIDFSKDILPHLVAIAIFLIIILIFFSPQIAGNKTLHQHDVFQGRAAGQELHEYRVSNGEEGLWINSMFSGMPGYLINVGYNDYILNIVSKIMTFGLPNPASFVFLSLLCYYIMLLCFGIRPYLAIAGALVFGLSTFNIISVTAGHNSKIYAVAFMPLVIGGIRLAFSNKLLLGFGLTVLALALEIRANHLQITYYLLLITVGYGLVQLCYSVEERNTVSFLKTIGILVIAALLAVGANAGRLWTVYEYGQYSIRGKAIIEQETDSESKSGLNKEYAFRYSNGIFEPMVLFVPNILGGSSRQTLDTKSNLGEALKKNGLNREQINQQLKSVPTYWGSQPLTAPYYVSAITLLLFIIGVLFADSKYKAWLILMTVFGIVLSWGKNFELVNYFLFDYLPFYNKFRSVTFAIIIPIFCMPLLGMLGLKNLIATNFDKIIQKKTLLSYGISGGLALILVLVSGLFSYKGTVDAQLANLPAWYLDAIRADRLSLFRSDALRSLIFISLAFGFIWFFLKDKISYQLFGLGFVFLMALDMTLIGKRMLKSESFSRKPYGDFIKPTEADALILSENETRHRVLYLPNPFNDAKTSYHHSSVGGYHGAKLRRYQDLIDRGISVEINTAIAGLRQGQADFSSLSVINMLDTKYLVTGADKNSVIKNYSHNGHAWFVSDIVSSSNPTDELSNTISIDTKTTATVDISKFTLSSKKYGSEGNIILKIKDLRHLEYESTNDQAGFAVFSEVFYEKGWKAFIDDQEVEIKRANFVLRALEVPEGKHKIEFKFNPVSYSVGTTIGSIASIIILISFIGVIGLYLYRLLIS